VLTGPEVRNKVADDMAEAEIFEDGGFTFKEEIKPLPTAVVTGKGTVITIPPAAAAVAAAPAGGKGGRAALKR
jgi:hypothetical protein